MKHSAPFCCLLQLIVLGLAGQCGEPVAPEFEMQEIDSKVAIGYGLAIGDVDGDKKLDILLADKKQIVWYRNPDWKRILMWENKTALDNVCIAAKDLDGDGKVEVAIGAGWAPADTVNSGTVHYLVAPEDRTQPWTAVDLHREPTVHRMKWVQGKDGKSFLVVAPLHGQGNKDAQGAGVKILAYHKPDNARDPWKTELIDESMHLTHNLDIVQWDEDPEQEFVLCGREGIVRLDPAVAGWTRAQLAESRDGGKSGAGEVRVGKLAGGKRFVAAVEPFHGNQLAVYRPVADDDGKKLWERALIDDTIKEGHALACADLAGTGSDWVIAGWRSPNKAKKVGINLYAALDGGQWKRFPLDDDGIACEDLMAADLNDDGRIDVIGAGRNTKNLRIYWNRGIKP